MTADPISDRRACEACGLISVVAEYVRVRTTNGGLHLCRQCLDEFNAKNPELERLAAALDSSKSELEQFVSLMVRNEKQLTMDLDAERAACRAAEAEVKRLRRGLEAIAGNEMKPTPIADQVWDVLDGTWTPESGK